jgi:hypothetical protein
MPGSSLSWSSVAELRSTRPDLGALDVVDLVCDAVELAFLGMAPVAIDRLRMQAAKNDNARMDAFLIRPDLSPHEFA